MADDTFQFHTPCSISVVCLSLSLVLVCVLFFVFCLIHRSLFGNCVRSSVWPAPMSDLTIVQINLISGYKNKFFAFAFYPQPKTNIFDCNVCACKYVSMSFVIRRICHSVSFHHAVSLRSQFVAVSFSNVYYFIPFFFRASRFRSRS